MHSAKEQDATESPSLYFDTLPENPLDNIVRFLSDSPRAHDYSAYIRNIFPLYAVKGDFAVFIRARFSALTLYRKGGRSRKYRALGTRESTAPNFHVTGKARDLAKYFLFGAGYGEAFTTLVLNHHSYKKCESIEWARMLRDEFPNARNFKLLSDAKECECWIRVFAERISSLSIFYSDLLPHVAEYASNVRHLYLPIPFKSGTGGAKFWASVGITLETLTMKFISVDTAEIEYIQKYCRELKDIHIKIIPGGPMSEALCSCISSYGDRLNFADLSLMSSKQMMRVTSACRKARFGLQAQEDTLKAALEIIGDKLDTIRVEYDAIIPNGLPIRTDWSACSNIRDITFSHSPTITIADITRCFETPKFLLKHIELDLMKTDGLNEIIHIIAGRTAALERFNLKSMNQPDRDTFKKLVHTNKALRFVRTEFRSLADNQAVETVQSFLRSPALKELEVNCDADSGRYIRALGDIARAARFRNIWISILGVRYLQ